MKILSLKFCPPLQFNTILQLSVKNLLTNLKISEIQKKFYPQKYLGYIVLCTVAET